MVCLLTFPARGTWIEITVSAPPPLTALDVPRKGNVDRNNSRSLYNYDLQEDVPRKGNVDRNGTPAHRF